MARNWWWVNSYFSTTILCPVVPCLEEISGKLNQTLPLLHSALLPCCRCIDAVHYTVHCCSEHYGGIGFPVQCTLEVLEDSPGLIDAVQLILDSVDSGGHYIVRLYKAQWGISATLCSSN